ncbi:MAG: hypothetical protein H6667_22100 [Ardenticatenaceae bacterium]|nr:hypothetical protein [Ardenticatenaceae bacterium]
MKTAVPASDSRSPLSVQLLRPNLNEAEETYTGNAPVCGTILLRPEQSYLEVQQRFVVASIDWQDDEICHCTTPLFSGVYLQL